MKIALIIPVYNRSNYVQQCFDSLVKLTVKPDMVVIVDDASTESIPTYPGKHIIITHDKNKGVRQSLTDGIEKAISLKADLFITLDSDAIVKPDFISILANTHKLQKAITSGFNNPKEPFISDGYKKHANGINFCFNLEQYEQHIKPALSKHGNWDFAASKSAGKVAITVPSCVQHIGIISSLGHTGADRAHDFNMLQLPDVTLFGIDSHDITGIQRAAEISQRGIVYGGVNIITDDLFTKNGGTEVRRSDYSKFMMKELGKHFDTSHVLTIHADGYVLAPEMWTDEFLEYDYIGATWWYKDNMNVGNGGFSLRSKKLCDILAQHNIEHYHPEDHHICRTYRPALEKLGIKFAPEHIANKFSIEAYNIPKPGNKWCGQFGFHGPHVDLSMLPEDVQYKREVERTISHKRNNVTPQRKPVVYLNRRR